MKPSIIITCEHAGNHIPREYTHLFRQAGNILDSHRGWDPGAFQIAEFMAEHLQCPLFSFHETRLLIEVNRSIENPELYSEFSTSLSHEEKLHLVEDFYLPYRKTVESEIRDANKPAIHLSIHTFTPELNGITRKTDIGLLFDPGRILESHFCELYGRNLSTILPSMDISFNEPYKGTDDGFTTYLRTRFFDEQYAGIEVEVNQKFVSGSQWSDIQTALLTALPL